MASDRVPTAKSQQQAAPARPCQAALLTPRGRGAVATVTVTGPGALDLVGRLFRPASGKLLADLPPDRIVFGHWQVASVNEATGASDGDEVVVCRRSTERIELHCHGGTAAVEQVLDALAGAGCKLVSAADWLLGQAADRLVAEARLALAEARTLRAAGVLLDQYRGALSRSVVQALTDTAAAQLTAAQHRVHSLLTWSHFGRHLITPWQVVLVGRTNAGKSSLLNALLGYPRALVDPAAGTTRDVLTASTAVDGWPVELADTAGSRAAASALETEGQARAARHVQTADLVLVVADAAARWSDEDERWVRGAPHAPLIVHNKSDLVARVPDDRPTGIAVSALTGAGLSKLLRVIARRLVPHAPAPGTAIPFLDRHERHLTDAFEALVAGDAPRAEDALRALLAPAQ